MAGPLNLTDKFISATFGRLVQTPDGVNYYDGLGNLLTFGAGTSGTSGTNGGGGGGGTGTSGTSGLTGTAGTRGTSGSSGTSGTLGTSGSAGTSGTSGYVEFYFQTTVPSPNPTSLGARWIDSDNGKEYVWVNDGTSNLWMQPTQLGSIQYNTFYITGPTYSPNFSYEYYGVIYTTGICTITLPLGVVPGDEGRIITIADEVGGISNGNRGIYVQGSGGQLINGQASILMKIERMSLTFMFRNNSWKTI